MTPELSADPLVLERGKYCIGPNNQYVAAAYRFNKETEVKIYDLSDGSVLHTVPISTKAIGGLVLALAPDASKFLFRADSGTAQLINSKGKILGESKFKALRRRFFVTPDVLATHETPSFGLKFWDANNFKPIQSLTSRIPETDRLTPDNRFFYHLESEDLFDEKKPPSLFLVFSMQRQRIKLEKSNLNMSSKTKNAPEPNFP